MFSFFSLPDGNWEKEAFRSCEFNDGEDYRFFSGIPAQRYKFASTSLVYQRKLPPLLLRKKTLKPLSSLLNAVNAAIFPIKRC